MDYQIYYMFLLAGFTAVAYMMYVDPNVSKFIVLLYKMGQISFHRLIFWLKFYPKLRYDTTILKWKSNRILNKQLKNGTPKEEAK
jgi:hypothetical protein